MCSFLLLKQNSHGNISETLTAKHCNWPAVGNDGSGIRRVAGLHPTEEGQEGGGVLWHAVIRPRRELELTNFPLLTRAILETTVRGRLESVYCTPAQNMFKPSAWLGPNFQDCRVQTPPKIPHHGLQSVAINILVCTPWFCNRCTWPHTSLAGLCLRISQHFDWI